MTSGGFASSYQSMPREQALRFIRPNREPAAEPEPEQELRTLLLTRRGAVRMFATGWLELGSMLLVLLGLHQILIDQPIGLLFLIIPASTVGVMLAMWGMLAWCVNVIRAEMAEAGRERGMILENQARLIAQNERIIGSDVINGPPGPGKYDTADLEAVAARVREQFQRRDEPAGGQAATEQALRGVRREAREYVAGAREQLRRKRRRRGL